jgi:hypothetical protein
MPLLSCQQVTASCAQRAGCLTRFESALLQVPGTVGQAQPWHPARGRQAADRPPLTLRSRMGPETLAPYRLVQGLTNHRMACAIPLGPRHGWTIPEILVLSSLSIAKLPISKQIAPPWQSNPTVQHSRSANSCKVRNAPSARLRSRVDREYGNGYSSPRRNGRRGPAPGRLRNRALPNHDDSP